MSITVLTEFTYDWKSEQWSVLLAVSVIKVAKFGGQMFSYGGGIRYYTESTDGGSEGWGARLVITFMFPK